MRIAISGCGIAGPTLAWWLRYYGHEPVLLERADALRAGGYLIDFWGTGFDVAERMGLLPALKARAYRMKQLRTVTAHGRATSSIDVSVFDRITEGRYFSIARSDLSAGIFQACDGIETRFSTELTELEDRGDRVIVGLSKGASETFDIVIGADGLHSRVRSLVFGPQDQFERRLGFRVAAFTLSGYRPREELTAVSHTLPGRYLARVSLRDDRTLFLMVVANRYLRSEPEDADAIRSGLRAIFRGTGWESDAIVARIDEADDLYFDRASQIRMRHWCKGRVALIGDAAAAPSLLAGEGTSLAMTGARVLAGELARSGNDVASAFRGYEEQLKTFLTKKQDAALRFTGYFAPKSWIGLIARDVLSNVASVPVLANWMLAGAFRDNLDLPDYA